MLDLLQLLADPQGFEVAWDYCLESGKCLPLNTFQVAYGPYSGSGKRGLRGACCGIGLLRSSYSTVRPTGPRSVSGVDRIVSGITAQTDWTFVYFIPCSDEVDRYNTLYT